MAKELYIKDFQVDQDVTDFFLVKTCQLRTGSNGKTYLDIALSDKSGDISAKKWDVSPEEYSEYSSYVAGDIVKIKALVSEWNGAKQLKLGRIRLADSSDNVDMKDLVKAAPEDSLQMWSYIHSQAEKIEDPALKQICLNTLEENKDRLQYYPAAKANHHSIFGGLLYHTRRMLTLGLKACEVYSNLNKDWVICGVIMHDMEKLNEIDANEFGISSGYSMKGNMLGHLVMGAVEIEKKAKQAGLSEEKTVMLEHMILAHHNEPDFGSPVRPCFPEAELLHHLDMIDARMYDFEEALSYVKPGEFSERIKTLDSRKLYRPTFDK